jgi:predicted dehydrogenase
MDTKDNKPLAGGDTRRDFIKKTATAAAAVATTNIFRTPVYGASTAPSTGKVIGANDRIVIGHIGVGGQGSAHLRAIKTHAGENNVVQAATCDVWKKRIEGSKAAIEKDNSGAKVEAYDDYRKVLDRKDIDAVVIATVDHWHTKIAVDALNSGKHVYVEKPMTRYLEEAFEIYDTVKKTGRKLQVGSQGCSDAKWHKAAELIRGGKVGQLVLGQGSYMRNNPKGEWNYNIDPDAKAENLDWQQWLGPVKKKVPFNADHYFRWRKYYPYCAGLLGDLFPHRLHPLMLATGAPEFPLRVCSIGNKRVHTDKLTPGTPERDVPESVQLLAEFPSGYNLMVTSATVNQTGIQDLIRGHKGTVYFGGSSVELKPEKEFAEEVDPENFPNLKPGEDIAVHERNWFEAIRNNKEPNAGIDLAIKVQTVISLAEMSERLSIMCVFDEKTRKITTGDGKAVKPLTYGTLPLS